MDSRSWRTSGPVAGILFVVLLVLNVVAGGDGAPMPDKSVGEIVKWYSDHRSQVGASAMFGTLGSVAFIWFLVHVRRSLAGGTDVFGRLRDALVISGVATSTVAAIAPLPRTALAVTVNRPDLAPSASVVRMLADLNVLFRGPVSIFLSLTMASLAAILLKGGIARRWVGWIALGSAVASLVGGCAAYFPTTEGKPAALSVFGLIGLVLFAITILTMSIILLTGSSRSGEFAAA